TGGTGSATDTVSTNTNTGTPPPPSNPSTLGTTLQVTPVEGPFLPAVPLLYQVYDSTHQLLLGTTGTAGSQLVLPASLASGWVLVQVSQTNDSATQTYPDYQDEYSRTGQTLDAPLRAWVHVTQGARTAASVTPLTELAVRLLEQAVQQGTAVLNADSMAQYNAQVASLFGLSDALTSPVEPLVDVSGNTLPGNAYGQVLQALSALASVRSFGSPATTLAWLTKEIGAASSDALPGQAAQRIARGYLAEAEKLLDDQHLLTHAFSRSRLDAPLQFSIHQAEVQTGAAQLSDGSSNAQPNALLAFADARLAPAEISASATLLLPVPLSPQSLAGDVLTLTLHGLQADSSLPQQTLHYSLQSSDALNNYASIPLAEVPAAWWSAAMGQRIGITAQLSTAALPDGLATGAALSSAAYSVLPSGVLVSNRAATPVLQAGLGVADGATAAEASQASGIFLLTADTGASISLTFSDGTRTIGKTLIGQGSPQAIVLDAWDIGMADNQLHDGSISVVAIASNRDGPASSPAAASFTLDTQAPVVQRLVAEASKTDGTPLIAGDVLFFTIGFDEVVVGAAVAPTLTIGLETGIALTPLVSTGNSRSWSYTVSTSGIQPDQGAVSLVLDTHANGMGDAPSGLGDAAGNALDAAPGTLVLPTAFSVDTRTPAAPVLAVGAGVANGATAAEATQASGILDFSAAAGSSVTLQLVDGSGHSIHKTFSASGSAQAVVLEASDIGSAANQLHDGPIAVFAQATHAAGTSSASLLSLQLDSVAPQLQSAVLSSSRSNGSAAAMGDELTYTLSYDSQVFGAPGAPTLTIGLEAGIAMTPVIASGASRSWRYVLGSSGRPDSGAIAVVDGNYLSGIRDAAGNQAVDATASNGSHGGGGSSGESIPPEAPILTLGQGVADGASALEAVQASGVMLLTAPAGNTVHVRFSDGLQSVTQTVLATGSAQPLVLGAADVGLSLTALHDGPIAVWAVASNAAGLSSSASLSSFTLDSTGPQLLGVVISAAKSANTPLVAGDVLTISANYDEAVFGTPTAPTLGIGSETGITLTPLVTEGSQRSWTYALSASGTPDNGAITLEGGNFTTALHDAAGNPAFHADSDAPAFTGFYSANSNTPAAPELRLASGVAPAASAAKATATSGVLTFTAEAQSTVVVAFSDGQHSLQKTLQATGSEQAVVLVASDLGSGPQQLQDGNIRVSATAHNAAGPSVSSNALLFLLDTSAPASTPSGLAFSSDTAANGSSNSDRVTRTATQTISASLSAALASGETLQASLDGGAHWSDISTFVSGQRLDWSGVNLLAGANSLLLQVVDQAGNAGSVLNQPYELDSLTPSTVISAAALSADTAVNAGSNSDFITNSAAQSISANLTAPLGSAEMLYGSLDGGANWTDISGFVSGQSLTWSGQSLTASNTLLLKVSDAAGNDGAVFSQPYVLDRSAPTTSVSSVGLLRDTGSSSSDLVTSEASQIVHGQLAAPLRAGETVQVSVDGGTSWQQASATVGTTLYSLAGATLPQASLPDGSNSLQVKLSDAAGNDGPVFSQPYVLDRSAPAVPQLNLGSDIRDGANAAEATASSGVLDIRAEAGSSLLLTLSDGTRSIRRSLVATGAAQPVVLQASDIDGPNALQQGSISVTASATDSAGNVSSTVSSSFFLDNQPPGAAALFLGDGVANGATAAEASASSGVVQLRAEAGNRVVVTFSVDGHSHSVTRSLLATGALQAVTLDAADVGSAANQLPDGSILVTALARNAAGNVSSTTQVRFVLDTSAPGSSVNALQLGNDSGSSNSDFMTRVAEQSISASLGTAPAEGETLYGSVDGGSHWTDLTPYLQGSTLRWSGITLLDGPHTLLVKRTDLAGNDGPITRQDYVLDRSAPAAPVLQLGSGVADGATLAEAMQASGVLLVSAEPGSQVTVDFGSGIGVSKTLVGTGAAQAVTLDAADLVFAEANRLHWPIQVLVTVRDVAGNSSTDSSSWLLDANPPQASILIPAAVQNGGASLAEASAASGAFSVSSESGASVLLTLSDGTRTLSQSWVSDGSAHAVSLDAAAGGSQAGPLQDGTIHITAVATDPAGNSGNPVRAS
ncbi:MAG: Ig-like domain-containing protein, partial [Rhodoferax sp.]|nr:Ig-like domain-containing protein [Rhodoferax sp.]